MRSVACLQNRETTHNFKSMTTDKYGSTDTNWYTSEAFKEEHTRASAALEMMKVLEKEFMESRTVITEKTSCGKRIRYVKK